MKIYKNTYTPSYERYFFYSNNKCIEVHNIEGGFKMQFAHYNKADVSKDPTGFPVVGNISEKEITDLILSKVVN